MTRVHTILAAVLALLASLLAAGAFVPDLSTASAQTPCDSTNSPSPLPAGTPIFRRNDTVYVIVENSITSQDQKDQIGRGLASWQGTAGLNFVIGPPPTTSTGPTPTILYFQNANLGRLPYAVTSWCGNHTDGSLSCATITFNTGAMTAPQAGDPGDGPFYDPTKPGYDTIFQKETAHEVGHPIGLADENFANGVSVMNRSAWNCPNDNCGRKPVNVSPCDKTSAEQQLRVDNPNGTVDPGSGGEGGTGVGECPCGDCSYGCSGGGNGGEPFCTWIDVGGQCYAGVDSYDDYGYLTGHEDGYCDPPQTTYVCF